MILVFPVLGQGREIMALSHVAHGVTALVMILVIIGHIYIGTIGMEGALEGMTTGYCDLNWAREHHDWWAERCKTTARWSLSRCSRRRGFAPGAPKRQSIVGDWKVIRQFHRRSSGIFAGRFCWAWFGA